MLPVAIERLAPGGRLAVIAFHSLEDRIVKRTLEAAARPWMPREFPLRASEMPQPLVTIARRAIRPGAAEIEENPRTRSARLRVAERTAALFQPSLFKRIEPDAWRN